MHKLRKGGEVKKVLFLIGVCALMVCSASSYADVPRLINYQGMLTDDVGNPLSGSYDLVFRIYDDTTGGNLKWSETYSDVAVEDGLFNVTLGTTTALDLAFDQSYWLEVEVAGETLSRLRITSAGYAYRAQRADTASYALSAPGGSGSEYWTLRITDTADTTLITKGMWGLARYGNVLYGNADSTHVNLGVACTTGVTGNDHTYCTVGGGFGNGAEDNHATVGGGRENKATDFRTTVAGGGWNVADNTGATVGGGDNNVASGMHATVGGGEDNTAGQSHVTIAGGQHNTSTWPYCTISGGSWNVADGTGATVAGGGSNSVTGSYGVIGGGQHNSATHWYSTVSGGEHNCASGQFSTVGGGATDTAAAFSSFVAGCGVKATSSAEYTFAFGSNFTTSTPNAVIFCNTENETKVGIDTASPGNVLTVRMGSATNPVADAWSVYSSKRWKTNVQPIPHAVEKVQRLQGVYFDWTTDGKRDLGMIAEDVGEVIPEVVAYEENGIDAQSLDYARLVALLVEAIKEQQREIEMLKEAVGNTSAKER
jgi:hypothetical protein